VVHTISELHAYLLAKQERYLRLEHEDLHPFNELDKYTSEKHTGTVFVCGGAQIYEEFFRADMIDEVILSVVDMNPEGDTAFPYFEENFSKISEKQME
jgi:dihydrofolate reductase